VKYRVYDLETAISDAGVIIAKRLGKKGQKWPIDITITFKLGKPKRKRK
jgi:hypothetical protein